MNKPFIRTVAVAIATALLLGGCATNPVTGKSEFAWVSEEEEIQLGEQVYAPMQQSQGGEYDVDEEPDPIRKRCRPASRCRQRSCLALRVCRFEQFCAKRLGSARRQDCHQSRAAHRTRVRGGAGCCPWARNCAFSRPPYRPATGTRHFPAAWHLYRGDTWQQRRIRRRCNGQPPVSAVS